MSKFMKILLGIATVWPFLYMILFICFILFSILLMPSMGTSAGGPFAALFLIIFPLHLLTMLLIMGLTVFYMVNIFRNERIDKDKKLLWALVLFMGNMFAMPIYWYLYIWSEEEQPPASPSYNKALNNGEASSWVGHAASSGRAKEYVPPSQPPDWRGE
jgi:hypothetical protein